MNIKLRLKNKTTLLSLVACVVAFVYQVLGILGVTVPISQDEVMQTAGVLMNLLVTLGVLVDPTTKGIGDSEQARRYRKPM